MNKVQRSVLVNGPVDFSVTFFPRTNISNVPAVTVKHFKTGRQQAVPAIALSFLQ